MFTKTLRAGLLCLLSLIIASLVTAALCIGLANLGPSATLPKPNKQNLVIDSVTIVDVLGETLTTDRQIVISNGVIQAIHAAGTEAPSQYKHIDAKDAYVVPGLIDMHTHIYDRKDLINSLVHGVTTVRNMRGFPAHLRWKKELSAGRWLGTNLITSSPILDNEYADLFQHAIKSRAHARATVQAFHQAGYDFLKIYNALPPEILSAVVVEASAAGLAIVKHGPYDSLPMDDQPFDLSMVSHFQSVEHVEEIYQTVLRFDYDQNKLSRFLEQLKDSKTPLTPTLATFEHLTKLSHEKESFVANIERQRISPFFKFLIEQTSVKRWINASNEHADWNRKELDILLDITKKASESGIRLLVGSDQGTMYMLSGVSTHHEMRLLQSAGISNMDILQAATINAAKALQRDADFGSVSVGKQADLLLIKNNPLDDIKRLAQPYAVIKGGSWLDQTMLSELSQIGESPASWLFGLGYFLEDLLARSFI